MPPRPTAQAKAAWQDYLTLHTRRSGNEILDKEPHDDAGITQSAALKDYKLKKEDLVVLRQYEKKNSPFGKTMSIFIEFEAAELVLLKKKILEGGEAKKEVKKEVEGWGGVGEVYRDTKEEQEQDGYANRDWRKKERSMMSRGVW